VTITPQNIHPNNSAKVAADEMVHATIFERVKILESKMEGMQNTLYGKEGEVGLIGRLKIIEEKLDSIYKVFWIIASAFIGFVIIQIFELVTKAHLTP